MPLFKRNDTPELDRPSRTEERKIETHNWEMAQRAGASDLATLEDENERLLKRKAAEEPTEFLWPYLLGWQYLRQAALHSGAGSFEAALAALRDASSRSPLDPRGPYGVATVYYTAATQALLRHGGWPEGEVSLGMSLTQLYENALREFRKTLELTDRGKDRRLVQSSIDTIELALRRRQQEAGFLTNAP